MDTDGTAAARRRLMPARRGYVMYRQSHHDRKSRLLTPMAMNPWSLLTGMSRRRTAALRRKTALADLKLTWPLTDMRGLSMEMTDNRDGGRGGSGHRSSHDQLGPTNVPGRCPNLVHGVQGRPTFGSSTRRLTSRCRSHSSRPSTRWTRRLSCTSSTWCDVPCKGKQARFVTRA